MVDLSNTIAGGKKNSTCAFLSFQIPLRKTIKTEGRDGDIRLTTIKIDAAKE